MITLSTLNLFLLEDNPTEREQFKNIILDITNNQLYVRATVQCFASDVELSQHLPAPSNKNIFILDLEINGDRQAGLRISKTIRKHDPHATIIFLTVHDEFLYVSYKYRVSALDFIDKHQGSIRADLFYDLQTVLNQQKDNESPMVAFHNSAGFFRIAVNRIAYFETNHEQTRHSFLLTTDNEQIEVSYSLNQLAELLTDYSFFRVHRAFLVNVDNILKVDLQKQRVEFVGGTISCPLSRLKKRGLLNMVSGNPQEKRIQWSNKD